MVTSRDLTSPSFEGRKNQSSSWESDQVWDPGGQRKLSTGLNVCLSSCIGATAMIAATDDDDRNDMEVQDEEQSRTELDSHANMCVVGKHALVLSNTGKKADVSPFTQDYDAL